MPPARPGCVAIPHSAFPARSGGYRARELVADALAGQVSQCFVLFLKLGLRFLAARRRSSFFCFFTNLSILSLGNILVAYPVLAAATLPGSNKERIMLFVPAVAKSITSDNNEINIFCGAFWGQWSPTGIRLSDLNNATSREFRIPPGGSRGIPIRRD